MATGDRRFEVDPDRLYDVGPRGGAWTGKAPPPGHLTRIRWLFAAGIVANALTWTLAAAGFVLGGPGWGAGLGLLALLTLPLLALPLAYEGITRWRARRRHRSRPPDFPPA